VASKLSEYRAELVTRLAADATLVSHLSTDEESNKAIYERGHATGLTVPDVLVYGIDARGEIALSEKQRYYAELEIEVQLKPGSSTPVDDALDEVEERLDALLKDWRPRTTNINVRDCYRTSPAMPSFDASGLGHVGRIWTYTLVYEHR
jgi:hypothetical protein